MRSGQKKPLLSFSQRLKKINFTGKIPDKYTDQFFTCDIMDDPVLLNGKHIMDYRNVVNYWKSRIADYEKKTDGGKYYSDPKTDPVFENVGAGHTDTYTMEPLTDLREEIEGWVFGQELQYIANLKGEEREIALIDLKKDIEKISLRIEFLSLDTDCGLAPEEKESELSILLMSLDRLNKTKSKLTDGLRYYDDPQVLQFELTRLLKKQEMAEATSDEELKEIYFSEEDKRELEICYNRISPRLQILSRTGLQYLRHRPTLFQMANPLLIYPRGDAPQPAERNFGLADGLPEVEEDRLVLALGSRPEE